MALMTLSQHKLLTSPSVLLTMTIRHFNGWDPQVTILAPDKKRIRQVSIRKQTLQNGKVVLSWGFNVYR